MAVSGKRGFEVGEPPGGGEEDNVASMAISGELGPEVGELPGGGEEEVVTINISDEPGPEVGEPLRHGHRSLCPVPATAATPSRPRRAVVTLP
jgi:hypothetical protein